RGWKTAVVELNTDEHFGGTCICSGCIPTKSLLVKSQETDDLREIYAFKDNVVEKIRKGTLKHVTDRIGATVINGLGRLVDDHTIDVNGVKYTSDIIVLATGSEPIIPPISNIENVKYQTSADLLKIDELPQTLLIIGGGRIGIEFALIFHNMGSNVVIFEGTDYLLPGEDKEISDDIKSDLISKGITIFTGKFVDSVSESIIDGKTKFQVNLDSGPNKGEYTGDALLVATGRKARVNQLNLDEVGILYNHQGIEVNGFLQTSIPNIFAIGDVIGNPMFTNWASYQSKIVLENLAKSRNASDQWEVLPQKIIPRISFSIPEFAAIGLTEEEAIAKFGDDVVVHKFYNRWLGKSIINESTNGYLKGIGIKGSDEIIGLHIWGDKAGDLIQLGVLAMENDLGWSRLADLVYGHPVLIEAIYSLSVGMLNQTKLSK
ncbi:MAG: NAD(P)/FAD-dependent oxidoreductase, partial [Candidatus Heimdallarchaeota archaeon]|nr:NAD(P)/FAD-dependent oxidoreductase [Candidatus Heimdallarchaeota archaeon]